MDTLVSPEKGDVLSTKEAASFETVIVAESLRPRAVYGQPVAVRWGCPPLIAGSYKQLFLVLFEVTVFILLRRRPDLT